VSFPRRRESRSDTRWIPCQARNNTLYRYYDDTSRVGCAHHSRCQCHSREACPRENGERESRIDLLTVQVISWADSVGLATNAGKRWGVVSKLVFNPLAPILGGRRRSLGDTPRPSAGGLLLHLRTMGGTGEAKLARDAQTPPNPRQRVRARRIAPLRCLCTTS